MKTCKRCKKVASNSHKCKKFKRIIDNKMRWLGDTNLEKRVIRINKKKNKQAHQSGELLDTIIHEELHAKHPNISEKRVVKKAEMRMAHMSKERKRELYAKFR